MKQRHQKENESARCCWVCGKLGGAGFTTALRLLGYDVQKGDVAHAHPNCIAREQRKLRKS